MIVLVSGTVNAQDCEPTNHIYIGGGIGGGSSETHDGFVAGLKAGYATKILGFDLSMLSFPSPSAPTLFAGHITKPFFTGNTKITLGAGAAYNLLTNDDKSNNGWRGSAYFEVTKLLGYSNAAYYGRISVTGTNFALTVGLEGIFKKY